MHRSIYFIERDGGIYYLVPKGSTKDVSISQERELAVFLRIVNVRFVFVHDRIALMRVNHSLPFFFSAYCAAYHSGFVPGIPRPIGRGSGRERDLHPINRLHQNTGGEARGGCIDTCDCRGCCWLPLLAFFKYINRAAHSYAILQFRLGFVVCGMIFPRLFPRRRLFRDLIVSSHTISTYIFGMSRCYIFWYLSFVPRIPVRD